MSEYIEFLDGKKYPAKNADRATNPEAFKDAGYLLKENDLVVDVDSLEKLTIEKMISFFGIKTQIVWTDRGAHFYYKKPNGFKGNKIVCPLGFEIEYKHQKNTPNGLTIKSKGEMRKIENEGIREDLPDIFKYKRGLKPLLGLDENEGRNKSLFAHRMRIIEFDRWKSILRFINNNIFAKPLDEEEFKTVSRDGVKPKAEKNNQPEIADYLINKYKIVSYLGKRYWYIENTYIADEEKINGVIAEEVPNQKTPFYKEIKNQMEYKAAIIDPKKTFDIKLRNGILRNGKFHEIDYQEFTPYSIDIPYFKDAASVQFIDDYLDHLSEGDESYKKRILEVMAHCFITDKQFKRMLGKFFILIGKGGNGKGTFITILTEILGEKNVSTLSIKQMADERYLVTMFGKLANLGDDIEDEFISKEQIKLLKNVSTCDRIQIRRHYEQSKDVELTCSLIFTSNHMIKAREKGEAYKRRVDWMPIEGKPKVKDPEFVKKITTPEALQYWIKLIVEAYRRLYQNKGFTPCEIVEKYNENYHLYNDNINQFLDEHSSKYDWIGMGKKDAIQRYAAWCEENEEHKQGKEKLYAKIIERFDLEYGKVNIKNKGSYTTTTAFYEKET